MNARAALRQLPRLTKPGLFITATDTGVGKTVITCAIARALRRQGCRQIGVCKPFASGCVRLREGLVSADAEALAHFADSQHPLEIVNPIRLLPPMAPGPAAAQSHVAIDWQMLGHALHLLDSSSDALLIEGVGGLLVPLCPEDSSLTVLDLILALGLPVLIVTRPALGTLNHTALTARVLQQAGAAVVGLVVNGYEADPAGHGHREDPSMASNPQWMTKMTGLPVLALAPRCPEAEVKPEQGQLAPALLAAIAAVYWREVLASPAG